MFEIVWKCLIMATNDMGKEKFLYAGCWPTKEKRVGQNALGLK